MRGARGKRGLVANKCAGGDGDGDDDDGLPPPPGMERVRFFRGRERRPLRVVVFSPNDVLGAWDVARAFFHGFVSVTGQEPEVALALTLYFEAGGARAGVREMLAMLRRWKEVGLIQAVGVITDSTDKWGWVRYLLRCLEAYAGTPGLFGKVQAPHNDTTWSLQEEAAATAEEEAEAKGVAATTQRLPLYRDMSAFSCSSRDVCFVDHTSDYTANGLAVVIPKFESRLCVRTFKRRCREEMGDSLADAVFLACGWKACAGRHPPGDGERSESPRDQCLDVALRDLAEVLCQVYQVPRSG